MDLKSSPFTENSNKNKDAIKRIFIFIMAVLTAMMLCMEFPFPWGSFVDEGKIEEMLGNLTYSMSGKAFISTLLTAGLYKVGIGLIEKPFKEKWTAVIFAILIAAVWTLGANFTHSESLVNFTFSWGQRAKTAIYYIGSAWLIYVILRVFCNVMDSGWDMSLQVAVPRKLRGFLSRHHFAAVSIFLLLCWALPVIACYPASFCNDSWNQLSQIFGATGFTAHHPPAHTLLMAAFVQLGIKLGAANLGLLLMAIFQAVTCALLISYSLDFLRKMNAPKWINFLTLVAAVLSPYVSGYVGIMIKDTLYTQAFVLMVLEIIAAVLDMDNFINGKKHMLLSALAIIGVVLLRNNGKYVLYPSVAVIAVLLIVKRKQIGHKKIFRLTLMVAVPIILALSINRAIIRYYDVAPGSIAEAMSLPFQQTARYIRDHGEEVTEEERAAIEAILPYEQMAERYDPKISDPIKINFNKQATDEQLKEYYRVWFKMFLKHPMTYALATIDQSYPLIYPFTENSVVYVGPGLIGKTQQTVMDETGISFPESLGTERRVLQRFFFLMYSLPIIGMISHTAPYTIGALFLSLLALMRKKYIFLLPSLPVLISIAIVVAGPAVLSHPRYTFPVVYSAPVMTAFFIYLCRQETACKKAR